MAVDFTAKDLHDGEFVKTTPKEMHDYATPEECDPCAELLKKNQALEAELEWFRYHHAEHHGWEPFPIYD